MDTIVDALGADEGMTCVVGAGGKKTTLYALAPRLERAVLTATVRIPIFDPHVSTVRVTETPLDVVEGVDPDAFPLGLVPEQEREDRYEGYSTETVDAIAESHDGPVIVKADGARTRELKAPNDREPQLPNTADTIVPIASVHAVGTPLTEAFVHRPERVAAIADIEVGEEITTEVIVDVLTSEHGGLKDVPAGATVVPLLNKVDDPDDESLAREIADGIHDRTDVDRVVLARMNGPELVDVVQ